MTNHSKHTIRIASIPGPEEESNPYLKLFYRGLEPFGINVVAGRLSRRWLEEHRGRVDILHFHWRMGFASSRFWTFGNRLARFMSKLAMAKRYGYKIVWTVHDFFPHRRRHIGLQYLANLGLARLSDGVFVNFHEAKEDVRRWYRRTKGVHVIPIGNYRPWYFNEVSQSEARGILGLPPNAFVYLLFGAMRPNRGIESAVQAFQHLTTPGSSEEFMLIAGKAWPEYQAMEDSLKRQIGSFNNIRRVAEFIPDDQVQLFFNAADAVLLPYRHIYSSSTALLAMTFARPIIAPRVGIFPELVHDERIGVLFAPGNLSSLVDAMKKSRDCAGKYDQRYLDQECDRYDWELIWPLAAKSYQEIMDHDN